MLRAIFVTAALALVLPVSAQAALSFAFDRAQARPGQLLHAFQADADGNPAPAWEQLDGVTLFLASLNNTNHRVRLGQMGIDGQGVWSITFRVPKIRPGLYAIAFFCVPCGSTSFASTLPGTRWTGKPGRVLRVKR